LALKVDLVAVLLAQELLVELLQLLAVFAFTHFY
jgi:hypothetical protein